MLDGVITLFLNPKGHGRKTCQVVASCVRRDGKDMKEKRLDTKDWYDKKRDLIMCLYCSKWMQRIEQNHLRKHGFESIRQYKEEYGILLRTPLKNKRLLRLDSERMIELRKKKRVNLFKKGETSIPLEYRKASRKGFSPQNAEFREYVSIGQAGKPKSDYHKKRMSEVRKGIQPQNLIAFAFKKGMRPKNKLYEEYTQCEVSGCVRKPIARYLCGLHYQRKYKKGDENLKQINKN